MSGYRYALSRYDGGKVEYYTGKHNGERTYTDNDSHALFFDSFYDAVMTAQAVKDESKLYANKYRITCEFH